MSDLDVKGLVWLYQQRRKAVLQGQARVQDAYWRGRIDEFVAQNAVTDEEHAQARAIVDTEETP